MPNDNLVPCPDCNSTGFVTFEDRHTRTNRDLCMRCGGRGTVRAATGETPASSFIPPDPMAEGRQWIAEAFAGFVNDPPDDDFQRGYLAALYVVAVEIFAIDPGPSILPPDPPVNPRAHLRLVSSAPVPLPGGAA